MPHKSLLMVVLSVVVFTVVLFSNHEVKALPSFGRLYGVSCATCHTSPPRLNETGYKFRAAGFRFSSQIGKGGTEIKPLKISDHTSIRLQARYDGIHTRAGSETDTLHKGSLFAGELYTFYGPWGKYISSNFKVTVFPDKSVETEGHLRVEGTVRATFGNSKRFFDIRAGVPHPLEGFGGSEYYTIGNKRPLFQEAPNTANFNQETFFTPLSFHQSAVTFGYFHGRTSIRAYVLGGLRLHNAENNQLEPFGKREPFTKQIFGSKHKTPDFQLFINRILHPEGGSVSLYYYKGNLSLPILDEANPNAIPDKFFQNRFSRLAVYGGYPIKRLLLTGAVQRGRDKIATGGRFASLGGFLEGTVPVNELTAIGARYDFVDPARNKSNNETNAVTLFGNIWIKEQLRIVPEYQYIVKGQGVGANRIGNGFQLRLILVK